MPSGTRRAQPKISVVTAVYNPGKLLDALVDSLGRQTMSRHEFEVVFVDDGSTDGSGKRLDALARRRRNVRVIHIPNSGWPGRPRNVGMDAATGEFILIVDHDDWLADDALERLYDYATRTGSDVVVGREVGHGFGVPRHMFRRNVEDARLGRDPLLALLTPHKLFRRSLLDEHGIRFPEGRRRLEDHQFVIQAYFQARRISILAEAPIYHWALRRDRGNATHFEVDPVAYYSNLRDILDIVDRHTEPGDERDRLYAHWYRHKMLHKLRGRRYVSPDDHAVALFGEIARLAQERFGPGVDRYIPPRYRILSQAVHAGDMEAVGRLESLAGSLGARLALAEVVLEPRSLCLAVEFTLADPDGDPLEFRREGDRVVWSPPDDVLAGVPVAPEHLDVSKEIGAADVTLVLTERDSRLEYDLPLRKVPLADDATSVRVSGRVEFLVETDTFAGGRPLPDGVWDASVQVQVAGWRASGRLPGTVLPRRDRRRIAEPFVTNRGYLSLEVVRPTPGQPNPREGGGLRRLARRVLPRSVRRAARDRLTRLLGRSRSAT